MTVIYTDKIILMPLLSLSKKTPEIAEFIL